MINSKPDKGAVAQTDTQMVTTFRLASSVRAKFKKVLFLRGESMQELLASTVETYIKGNEYLLDEPMRKRKKKAPADIKEPTL